MGLTTPTAAVRAHTSSTKLLVSIVIVTYNGLEVLQTCLDSLRSSSYPELDIVVVDNASVDGTAEYVTAHCAGVRLIRLEQNLGFAGGNNVGITQSSGEYVFLLNNDTSVSPEVIDRLVAFLEMHPEAAMVCPKVVKYDDPAVVDNLGLATYPDGITRGLGRGEPADWHQEVREILFPSGCACLCRRDVLVQVGLFDEEFHLLFEDADLGWRVRSAGWKCYCVPDTVVRHRYSTTLGPYSAQKAFYAERNRIWVAVKNFPPGLLWRSPFYTLLRYVYQAVGICRGEGAPSRFYQRYGPLILIWTLLRAYIAAAWRLPSMLRKRRELLRNRKVSAQEFRECFDRFRIKARDLALIA